MLPEWKNKTSKSNGNKEIKNNEQISWTAIPFRKFKKKIFFSRQLKIQMPMKQDQIFPQQLLVSFVIICCKYLW